MDDYHCYPIAVFQDRYSGVYSGGTWIAVANCDQVSDGRTRFWEAFDGAHGGDPEAAAWGHDKPSWVAVGYSPAEAIDKLKARAARQGAREE